MGSDEVSAIVDEENLRRVYLDPSRLPCPHCGADTKDGLRYLGYARHCHGCGLAFRVVREWHAEYRTEPVIPPRGGDDG